MVELVVVIVLLGILAATALPRFMDVDEQAHEAVLSGVAGSLQTGTSMFHAQWMAEGQPNTDTAITAFNSLRVNAAGYPYGTDDNSGGTSTVTDSADCEAIFIGLLQAGAPSIGSEATVADVVDATDDFTAVATAPDCTYYYTAETSNSGATVRTISYASATGLVSEGTATLP